MNAIILAGGVGTRLWPRSRQSRPKQFSDITGCGSTMLQSTVARLQGIAAAEDIYIVTGKQYVELAQEQVPQIPAANVLAEPCGRNTAAAIGLACIHLRRQGRNGVVAVLPADHTIQQVDNFQAALRKAEEAAEAGYLVTLGIEAHMPHTGYGYIKRGSTTLLNGTGVNGNALGANGLNGNELAGDGLNSHGELAVYTVEHFLEKPDLATAKSFLSEGGYYWNGGIFICRVDRMLNEFAEQMPHLYERLEEIATHLADDDGGERALAEIWPQLPDISIDYGVIEGAKQVAMVPLQAGWNDAGSWDALDQVLMGDESANVQVSGDMLLLESKGNIIYGDSRFMALIGVNDLVVVDTGDALLIGHKSQIQRVKHVVEHLRLRNRAELL
jgi:mannose-1-phosphate guanylyltransferase